MAIHSNSNLGGPMKFRGGPAKPGVVKRIGNFLSDAYTRNVLKKGGKTHAESEAALAEMKAKKQRAKGQK
jgi:hypothetical protein|tara:strand:+ start:48 stop:257 length:210 start_codon:yes stop_codon:yes gene_type:complete